MPRWASRITLEITGVRAERLQSISEADARDEGVTIEDHHMRGYCGGAFRPPSIRAFHDLWDSLNASRGHGWDTNPWVWVVEFKQVRGTSE
ncbi:Phage-related protein (fragment) [Burkholderia cenocepacia]